MSSDVEPEDGLNWLLELRLRVRGSPEATAIVDRCLSLLARAQGADAAERAALDAEVAKLADDLAIRFGPPGGAGVH
ncbi:hypothetical protein [uncultured Phenylobacterium sp.]|uniref:hypothetical protein n=1 Tax=uncultured Phenylobacterium sp. TaxID=349273 RepID=UPI0025F9B41B|nr:hypothetical protein [uncultured Phenylobacterium sp.]